MFANYSQVQDVTSQKYNLAPRKQFAGASVGTEYGKMNKLYDDEYKQHYERNFYTSTDGKTRLPPISEVYKSRDFTLTGAVMFMDTQRERDIDLGSMYQFDPMNEGECLISQHMADNLGVHEGDVVYSSIDMYNNLVGMIDIYNIEKDPSDLPLNKYALVRGSDTQITIPCRVEHIGN